MLGDHPQGGVSMKTQRKSIYRGSVLLAIIALCASVSYGQFNASIQGVVQDPSGAIVPNASLTLVSPARTGPNALTGT